jgi:hypothetical protein
MNFNIDVVLANTFYKSRYSDLYHLVLLSNFSEKRTNIVKLLTSFVILN